MFYLSFPSVSYCSFTNSIYPVNWHVYFVCRSWVWERWKSIMEQWWLKSCLWSEHCHGKKLEAAAAANTMPQWISELSTANHSEPQCLWTTHEDPSTRLQLLRDLVLSSYSAEREAPALASTRTVGLSVCREKPGCLQESSVWESGGCVGSETRSFKRLSSGASKSVEDLQILPFWYAEAEGTDCSSTFGLEWSLNIANNMFSLWVVN